MGPRWLNPPNVISAARIALCPAIFALVLTSGLLARVAAFLIFVMASVSDLWDGYLARKHGWITDTGKLLDPIADKLLLASTFVPFYILSRGSGPVGELPWWGELPLWVLLVVFGREVLVTVFRSWAARRGVVIAAGKSGKYKALVQNLFSGSLLLWYALETAALRSGWRGSWWDGWAEFHGAFVGVTLSVAVVLTLYSMLDYLWSYRGLVTRGT